MDVFSLVQKAKSSGFYLWLLNVAFERMVPFNKPHSFRIAEVGDYHLVTRLPYKKRNLNHLKGLHACALATLTEITGGFIMVTRLDPKKYRLILKKLEVDYLYQGKTDATAEFRISEEWLQNTVLVPLQTAESIEVITEINIKDMKGNQLTAGKAYWQVKDWSKVRTKA